MTRTHKKCPGVMLRCQTGRCFVMWNEMLHGFSVVVADSECSKKHKLADPIPLGQTKDSPKEAQSGPAKMSTILAGPLPLYSSNGFPKQPKTDYHENNSKY